MAIEGTNLATQSSTISDHTDTSAGMSSQGQKPITSSNRRLEGKRVAMVVLSGYPADPRPRRAAEALRDEGMEVELVCVADHTKTTAAGSDGIDVVRLPIKHARGGKLSYMYEYSAFLAAASALLAVRSLTRHYDLVYIHNMPDILVMSSLVPKALGAKVILDMHDPMPELMMTIFQLDQERRGVRLIRRFERWSMWLADRVVTVNIACKRMFGTRSCSPEKIGVVMNSPDRQIFPFRAPRIRAAVKNGQAKPFVIMYHGSLLERNGLDLAVDALAKIQASVPTAELRIYGATTPFLERVLDSVRSRGLQERVHYFGPKRLEELVPAIEDCDVGVIPNHRNPFTEINTPTRIFEYLALGKPVIAPSTPGIQDYFSKESLYFFTPGNSGDLAKQIEYVFLNPTNAVETVVRGQKVYLAHTWEQERETLVNLVSELLQGSNSH
jgi:glycosyltransferase involved in cell wall biosynthesis